MELWLELYKANLILILICMRCYAFLSDEFLFT